MIGMNRQQRRSMVDYAKAEAKKRPLRLTEIPSHEWPESFRRDKSLTHAWQSQKYLVQMFDETPFQGIDTRRISVCRVTLRDDGRWEDGLSWDELMEVKREIGFGHWYALEVYPRDIDVVNVANIRHLWMLAVPLALGWFPDRGSA